MGLITGTVEAGDGGRIVPNRWVYANIPDCGRNLHALCKIGFVAEYPRHEGGYARVGLSPAGEAWMIRNLRMPVDLDDRRRWVADNVARLVWRKGKTRAITRSRPH
ncbi:hypothetical protein ASG59_18585 [Methylobacterium sp. Leaf466]|nr:hypothetical protein ASG59_18585 [Methylobacterium sp. Leaf466]